MQHVAYTHPTSAGRCLCAGPRLTTVPMMSGEGYDFAALLDRRAGFVPESQPQSAKYLSLRAAAFQGGRNADAV